MSRPSPCPPALRRRFLADLTAYAALRQQIKALEADQDRRKAVIEALRATTGLAAIDVDGYVITRVPGGRRRLDRELLLAQGVTQRQIDAATIKTPTAAYTLISRPEWDAENKSSR